MLVNLADRANIDDGKCFPAHETIAEDCGMTERSVRDKLEALETKGHITIAEEKHRVIKLKSRFKYTVHPVLTPENGSSVTPENGAADAGKLEHRHRNATTPTPENGATPIYITPKNHINHKGNQEPSPLSSLSGWQLKKDLAEENKQIDKLVGSSDKDLLAYHRSQRDAIKAEQRRRGRSVNQSQGPDDLPDGSRNAGTYNANKPAPDLEAHERKRLERERNQQQAPVETPAQPAPAIVMSSEQLAESGRAFAAAALRAIDGE